MEDPKNKVDFLSPIQQKYLKDWELYDALVKGTAAMQAGGVKWCPQNEGESNAKYMARIARGVCYPGFSRAVRRAAGKPFVKPVQLTVGDDAPVPDWVWEIADDVDRDGTSLTDYARRVLMSGVKYGWTLPTCYWPATEAQKSEGEQKAKKIRPVFGLIEPPDILGWRTERGVDGSPELSMLRVREIMFVPDGEYGDMAVEFVRVLEPNRWRLFMRTEKGEFVPVPAADGGEGVNTLGRIPVNPFYIDKCGFFEGVSPFKALAYHNRTHWDSDCIQRNGLSWGRFPIVIEPGVTDAEKKKQRQIAPDKRWQYKDPQSKPYFMETTGVALKLGVEDLERLERIMEAEGLQPFVKRTGTQTATEKSINEAVNAADILAWIRVLESSLENQFSMAGEWYNPTRTLPTDFTVNVFSDFGLVSEKSIEELKLLSEWEAMGLITHKTLLQEGQRRGVVSESLDVDVEEEKAKQSATPGGEI